MKKTATIFLILLKFVSYGQDDLLKKAYTFLANNQLDSAEHVLTDILGKDSLNLHANSYLGALKYNQAQYRSAIYYSLKSIKLSKKKNDEYFKNQYIVGYAYHSLLSSEGLTYSEVDAMLDALKEYCKSPNVEDVKGIEDYIQTVKTNRPERYVKKWQTLD